MTLRELIVSIPTWPQDLEKARLMVEVEGRLMEIEKLEPLLYLNREDGTYEEFSKTVDTEGRKRYFDLIGTVKKG